MADGLPTSRCGDQSAAMLENATPDLYCLNAFRVLGLPVNATTGELNRQHKRLKLLEKLGAKPESAESGCLRLIPPPDGDAIRKAIQRLYDPENRLIDELFWLWPEGNDAEDVALRLLGAGRTHEAIAHWTQAREHGENGVAAAHNLAVLYHILALDIERSCGLSEINEKLRKWRDHCWVQSYQHWRSLSASDAFWNRVAARAREMDDPRLTTGAVRRMRQTLPVMLLTIGVQLAMRAAKAGKNSDVRRHLLYMRKGGFDLGLATKIVEQNIGPLIEQLKLLCEPIAAACKANPAEGAVLARRCLAETRQLVASIDAILNDRHHLRQLAHDAVARTIRYCMIDFGNSTENWGVCLDILREARALASGESLQEQLDNDIAQIDQNSRQEREIEELKKAVTGNNVYEVTISSGLASVVNICTCCLGPPTGEQTVSYSWEETRGLTRYTRTLSLGFPVCSRCRQHQSEYSSKRWLLTLLTAGISTVMVLLIATQIDGTEWLPFVLGGAVLTIVVAMLLSPIVKLSPLADAHACREPAVEMVSASDSRTTFRFHNPLYAHAFGLSNNAKVATRPYTKPPRGTYILQGKNAIAIVLTAVVIGAVAHSLVYAMVQEEWKRRPSKSAGSPTNSWRNNSPARTSPPTGDSGYQPSGSSSGDARRQPVAPRSSYGSSGLATRIDTGKARVKSLEAEIDQIDSDLESLSSRLQRYKRDIEDYESRSRLGMGVKLYLYQQAIDEHNRLVKEYNASLADRNLKYAEYSREIESVNDMVRRYNRGER